MIIGKRHLVLAALVLALGAAVYLNWQFAPSDTVVAEKTGTDQNGEAVEYVSAAAQVSAADASLSFEDEAVSAEKATDYFESTRAERQKTRDDAMATLQEIIENASLSEAQKTQAVNNAAQIAANMEKEAAIESVIKAKGYSDCVVIISDSQVNVVIPSKNDGITAADAAIIKDVVIGQINISPSQIKIIEAK